MKIFINDIPVKIKDKEKVKKEKFDIVISKKENLVASKLVGRVLVWKASDESIDQLLRLMTSKKVAGLKSMTFAVPDTVRTIHYIKGKFHIVAAGGGIARKGNQYLLIFRLKKWDLPKGKLEKGETPETGALREMEEETGVQVKLSRKIKSTWHTYIRNKKFVLKKTYWYEMECIDDKAMKPQIDEHIDKVQWMDMEEVDHAMKNSYKTIRSVVKRYQKLLEAEKSSGANSENQVETSN